MRKHFSSVKIMSEGDSLYYDTLEILCINKLIAYMVIQYIDEDTVNAHIWIPEPTHTIIKVLRDNLRTTFKDYMKSISKSTVLVSCRDEDSKPKRLIELLGFKLKPVYIGSMTF